MHSSVTHEKQASIKPHLSSYLSVILLAICLLALGIYADRVDTESSRQQAEITLGNQLNAIRVRLEGYMLSNTMLVKGLAISYSLEPDMSQERFSALTTPLLAENPQLRNIAMSSGMIIKYMNPIIGNEAAIGLDYRTVPAQYQSVKLAKETGNPVLAGPVNLVQGGRGFIVRVPVYEKSAEGHQGNFLGIIADVIDVEKFYTFSGLYNHDYEIEIAIRRNQSAIENEAYIFGEADVFDSHPVLSEIELPVGSWTLAAIPKDGWEGVIGNKAPFRLAVFLIALLILTPFYTFIRSSRKIEDNDARLRLLFRNSPVGIALNSYDSGDFIEANEALLEQMGYTNEEFLKLSHWDITPSKYQKDEENQLQSLATTGRYGPYEKEYIRKDRSLYPVLLNGILIDDASGNKLIWSFIEDISKRKQFEISLQRSQKMDAIGQLTGGIAHDFNNILGVILGNLELLDRDIGDENSKSRKRIIQLQEVTRRAATLTKQLLSFSRNKASQQESVDINECILKMEELIARSITPQIEISLQFDNSGWLTQVDIGDLEDSLLNLAINARDAMDGRGRLVFKTDNVILDDTFCENFSDVSPGEYVKLSVIDTGHGIKQEDIEHIFEPFFTTKDEVKGTGLGLSMVYGFIIRSGGFIDVSTQSGKGTTFNIYLPRYINDDSVKADDTKQSSQSLPRGTETILIVDDEADLLELASHQLRSLGYRILTAENGQQASDILQENPDIDLLFSDVIMPGGINGYDLAQLASSLSSRIKIILTSGYTGSSEKSQFDDTLLPKPYTYLQLAKHIRAVLDETG